MSTENTGKTEIPASGKTLLDAHKTDSFCVFAGNIVQQIGAIFGQIVGLMIQA